MSLPYVPHHVRRTRMHCPYLTCTLRSASQNSEFLNDLKFGIGDGQLHYYLYNYRVAQTLAPHEVGLILM